MQQNIPGNEKAILKSESPLRFSCNDTLPCFTRCCRDVNIYLTPYDLLRLRRALGIGSSELLSKYTKHYFAGTTGIPLVQLMMDPESLYCKLVTEEGCTVYDNRPWACRMYPLDLTSNAGEYTTIVGKDKCLGFSESSNRTVGDWVKSQGLEEYIERDKAFQSVIPEEFQNGSKRLQPELGKLLFLAYDLDLFSEMLKDIWFRKSYGVDDDLFRIVQEDDEALLMLAFRYIRNRMEGVSVPA